MDALSTFLDKGLDKGIEPLRWLLVIGIAYTVAMTILVFFQTPVSTPAAQSDAPTQTAQTRNKVNINSILGKHLFGEAGAAPEPIQEDDAPVATTRLPLELQSVFVASEAERSTAIVAQRGKPGRLYKVGETLPGNAELVEVQPQQIVLRRAGVREALAFPQQKSDKLTTEAFSNRQAARQERGREVILPQEENNDDEGFADYGDDDYEYDRENPDDAIAAYRDQFADDAEGTLNDLGLEASDSGGYRIGSGADSALLRQTGLQSGDVILSVNGQAVGDLQQDQLQIDNILAQGSARIEVQRGSRRFFITATLPGQR